MRKWNPRETKAIKGKSLLPTSSQTHRQGGRRVKDYVSSTHRTSNTAGSVFRFCVPGTCRLRDGCGEGSSLSHLCLRAPTAMQNLNVEQALESRGRGNKKAREGKKTGPQLSHEKPSFPDDVNSRGMKDKVRDAESCCKQLSEHIVFFKNTSQIFWLSFFFFKHLH